VSRPKIPPFGAEQRSRIARRAATARWSRQGRGVLTLAEIRDAVVKALGERKAKAYVFDAYARGDATARDEIYILVIVKKMPEDLLGETADLTNAIHKALGGMGDNAYKEIVLYLADEATFEEWKEADGTPYYAVATEGIQLV
jgi:predicted nucleotidyltransferase